MLRLGNIFLYNVRESSVAALLEKGLAIKNSKSKYKCKSVNFKSQSKSKSMRSKSGKNGLKSGLKSKWGLKYYKPVNL